MGDTGRRGCCSGCSLNGLGLLGQLPVRLTVVENDYRGHLLIDRGFLRSQDVCSRLHLGGELRYNIPEPRWLFLDSQMLASDLLGSCSSELQKLILGFNAGSVEWVFSAAFPVRHICSCFLFWKQFHLGDVSYTLALLSLCPLLPCTGTIHQSKCGYSLKWS